MRRHPALVALLGAAMTGCASGKLKEKDLEIGRLRAGGAGLESQVREREGRITVLEGEKGDAEARLSEAEEKLKAYEARVAYLEKSNKDLLDALEADHGELSGKMKDLMKEKDEQNRKLAETQKEKNAALRARSLMKKSLEAQQVELAGLKAQVEEAARQAAEAAAAVEKEKEARRDRVLKAREELGTLADSILKEMQADLARASQDGEILSLTLQEALLFEPQKAALTEAGTILLIRVAGAVKELAPRPVLVEAHTDGTPPKRGILGGFEDNWDLSAARAAAVGRFLSTRGGVEAKRITAAGQADTRMTEPPAAPGARSANARVVLTLEPAGERR